MTTAITNPTAVILAAGAGTRLRAAESRIPKPLTNLLGTSLLVRALRTVADAGIKRAVVVTGYRSDEVSAHARAAAAGLPLHLDVVRNDRWNAGNGSSLLAAEQAVGERCIVMMADHLTPVSFVTLLSERELGAAAGLLVVDDQPTRVHDLDEATKVHVAGQRITAIGKQLAAFNAVDTGVFSFDRRVFAALRSEAAAGRDELSAAVQHLAGRDLMHAVASDGSFWCDVDTLEDLAFVRGKLERQAQSAIAAASVEKAIAPA